MRISILRWLLFVLAIVSPNFVVAADSPTPPFRSSFRPACDKGDEQSCVEFILDIYFAAEKAEIANVDLEASDIREALNLVVACNNGSSTACGVTIFMGLQKDDNRDDANGGDEADDANESNSVPAILALAADQQRQIVSACDQGSAVGCLTLGDYHKAKKNPQDDAVSAALIAKAVSIGTNACETGNKRICDLVGSYYYDRDLARALDYYWRAYGDECSSTASCFVSGKRYGDLNMAHERTRNIPLAYLFFTKACDGGEMRACTNLGLIYGGDFYTGGDIVGPGKLFRAPSPARMHELLGKACDGGDGLGCFNLGLSIVFDNNMKLDDRSVALFAKACAQPAHRRACYPVGEAYLAGVGVPRDMVRAKAFFRKFCADDDAACLRQVERTGRAKPLSIDQVLPQPWH